MNQKELLEYYHIMGRMGFSFIQTKIIAKYANSHQRISVLACNRGLTQKEEKKLDRVRGLIAASVSQTGWKANFSGDPRGCTVKLVSEYGTIFVPTRKY